MKTCVSCKHFANPDKISEDYGKCKAPQSYTISFVTGKAEKQEFEYCSTLRSEILGYSACGVKAVWWEPAGAETEVDIEAGSRESQHFLLTKLISWINALRTILESMAILGVRTKIRAFLSRESRD